MVVVAELTAPAEGFPLGRLLAAVPGSTVRLDRLVPVGGDPVPYLWVRGAEADDIERELSVDDRVDSFEVVESVEGPDGQALVRAEWTHGFEGFAEAVVEARAALLDGVGRDGSWRFQVRFPDHETLSAFFDDCRDRGVDVSLSKVLNPGLPAGDPWESSLTESQREALLTALEEGYFEVPRQSHLAEVAELLGVSDSAASQRLRRGTAAFLRTAIAAED